MDNKKLLKSAIVGTIILAICCFSPVLVWLLTAAGLAAYISSLDGVLLPLLGLCLAVTMTAFMRQHKKTKLGS